MDFFNATHVIGACRMGANAPELVVDVDDKAHHLYNPYLCV